MGGEAGTRDSQVLTDLVVKRSSIKGQITKFKNYLTYAKSKETLSSIELAELTLKLGKFETLSNRFDDLQSQIEVSNSDNLSNEIDERDDIEQLFISNIACAQNIIQKYNSSKHDESVYKELHNSSQSSSAQCHVDHREQLGFKLPQIQIAKFDGSYFRWLEFRDTFVSLIHNSERIASIHKFHYLISYLTGDAARIISNLEVSSANYNNAWKLLCDRYDNKRQLINHHLNSLLSIQPATRESDRSLRFMVDHITKNLRALSSLGQPTNQWDVLIIHIMSSKLDNHTLLKWEECRSALDDVPNLKQFYKFLIGRADVLESINRNSNKSTQPTQRTVSTQPTQRAVSTNPNNNRAPTKSFACSSDEGTASSPPITCVVCHEGHRIYDCPTFLAKSIEERIAEAHRLKLCTNCLRLGHKIQTCRLGPCLKCKGRHNTLIHNPSNSNNDISTSSVVATFPDDTDDTIVNFSKQNSNQVLLSTAFIEVANPRTNQAERVRALLDCGSQSSFITQSLKERLSLPSNADCQVNVIGIGNQQTGMVTESCVAQLRSLVSQFNVTAGFLVLPQLTGHIPRFPIDTKQLQISKEFQLADPMFHQPAPTEVLIGADLFWDILGREQHSLGPNNPKLRSSQFGWIISGPMHTNIPSYNSIVHCNHSIISKTSNDDDNIHQELTKFWELEEVPLRSKLSESEKACEAHFLSHTSRLDSGRFSVGLPLKDSPDCLGESYNLAKKRLLNLEKRFKRQPEVKSQYVEFMREYADLGHLSESPIAKPDNSYFLCHHAVFKDSSESTKIRVVFDGSAPTSSGYSVNDILLVGPNMQDSLFSILIRARQYKYLLTGDVEKMYRQCLINRGGDRNLQLILWREDEKRPIKTLRLNTITYGMASSSYLSTRCLWQLGEECSDPTIKQIIQHDFYIDDLITGASSDSALSHIHKSVSAALQKGCFNLRKFKTNLPSILESTFSSSNDKLVVSESSSTLGIGWNPSTDQLHFPFKVPPPSDNHALTKRLILSSLFKIFDPLGLLSPCVIKAKILLQQLWLHKLSWDDPIPDEIQKDWNKFAIAIPNLSNLSVPRYVLCDSPTTVELHSFSDASQNAYGACIYLRSIDSNNKVTVSLLCSKSKVAPIKSTTIPRLELCAALLAAKLCKAVKESLRCEIQTQVHWCDSTIVLAWLRSSFQNLKAFVSNRISEICEHTNSASWRYVPTAVNPADLISRGISPDQISSTTLWWSGPPFLSQSENTWPILNTKIEFTNLPETKTTSTMSNLTTNKNSIIQFNKYSSLPKLKRIFALVLRFIYNTRYPKSRLTDSFSVQELNDSFICLCRLSQQESFVTEFGLLSNKKSLSPKSPILSLTPFFSDDRVIRVGGRLDASDFNFDKKHPVLLHANHHFTKILFEYEHKRNLHAGPQLLLAIIREFVWPINGRHLARRTFHNCYKCRRLQGKTMKPMMGNLPSQRVTPSFPFQTVGLDFAGPFLILNRKGRGATVIKCYLCLFVCLRYKCLHLEAVSDLSKDAFIMTFRRFVSRRGRPTEVFCDNGRNFVAGAKEINQFFKANAYSISDFASEDGIKFVFSPTYAPHFGGIFEAGVKSAKFHIKRVMGNSHLTYEELSTLFAQVESILNSRPLCPLSSSPDDFLCLTPGNFLIGRALTALPSPALEDCNPNNLQRYARLQQIYQHFWKRWQREYIAELQQRNKWKTNSSSPNVGDLVLLQEDDVPPLCWRLGRISRLFYGPEDGIPRVADVKTSRGCVRRPLVRLVALPTSEELEG